MLASKSASSCSFVCARPSWCIALLIDTSDVRVRVVHAECTVERLVWRDVRGVEAEEVNGRGGEGDSEGDSEASCRRLMLPSPPRPEDVTYVQGSRTEGRVGRREREKSSVNCVCRERVRG